MGITDLVIGVVDSEWLGLISFVFCMVGIALASIGLTCLNALLVFGYKASITDSGKIAPLVMIVLGFIIGVGVLSLRGILVDVDEMSFAIVRVCVLVNAIVFAAFVAIGLIVFSVLWLFMYCLSPERYFLIWPSLGILALITLSECAVLLVPFLIFRSHL